MGVRVGIDTGGTFTDLVAVDEESGRWYVAKVPSNPENPVAAVAAALHGAEFAAADVSAVVVGTTIGINAVLTRTGARVVYLTTKGFEDIPFIQRINRKYHYDFTWRKPVPLVERPDCVGVVERLDEEGEVEVELDADALRESLAELGPGAAPTAVAVCTLFSYLNPEHELRARDVVADALPGVPVSLSHDVAPIWREYERGNTAIVDAYLKPALGSYVGGLSDALAEEGVRAPWALLKSNGGHALAHEAQERPSHVLLSGIAGGAIGGAHFARAGGAQQGICLDMGGTSCDVCLIQGGEPHYSSDFEIEFGFPVSVQSVSTRTIGAGGGSIGWIDPGGFLQVGPDSAGADPGPACYGRGGEEATVTDADLVLGRLDPAYFLGGRLEVDPSRARAALQRLGERLDLDSVAVAEAMVRITNENMANAIRILTVEQGIDPRDFVLLAFGGAGATHGAEIADAIGIRRVFVPPNPGLCSAFGAMAAQVRVDAIRSVFLTDTGTDAAEVAVPLRRARGAGTARLRRAGSVGYRSPDPAVDRNALPGAELRAGDHGAPGDRRAVSRGRLRGLQPPLRGVLRLPAGGDPDRARSARRRCDRARGEPAAVRSQRLRAAGRARDTRRLLSARRLPADADPPP